MMPLALVHVAMLSMMYDVLAPLKTPGGPCAGRPCIPWAQLNTTIDSWWLSGRPRHDAVAMCAQLPNAPAMTTPHSTNWGADGAFCFCNSSSHPWASFGYCESAKARGTHRTQARRTKLALRAEHRAPATAACAPRQGVPEQINLQLAGPDVIVVGFVTFEDAAPKAPPTVQLGRKSGQLTPLPAGPGAVTHTYVTPLGERTYYMHFVTLKGLEPRATYFYRVRSGGKGAAWSDEFAFRAGYNTGETRVALFGDMANYAWNNMANLQEDARAGRIDAIVHLGDHAYNMGGGDQRRGDGYLEAFEPVLASVPWLPIIGNHEFFDGQGHLSNVSLDRYLNQTDGHDIANRKARPRGDPVVAHPPTDPLVAGASTTATSALGRLVATGSHHAAGSHGGVAPSDTSRWYSVDLGLMHLIALDLNMYSGEVDDCGEPCRRAQLEWLEADLKAANANRHATPWVLAFSHYPLYCSNCPPPGHEPPRGVPYRRPDPPPEQPGAWWASEACEYAGHAHTCTTWSGSPEAGGSTAGHRPVGSPGNDEMVPDLEPLFMAYGVDLYAAGHVHHYEITYPMYNGTAKRRSFDSPTAPVHMVSGNGGPPTRSSFDRQLPYSAAHGLEFSYTRLTAHNASALTLTQVANNGSAVLAELTIRQPHHGPFAV